MSDDRSIPRDDLARMVAAVDDSATLREASLAPSGHLPVYELAVDTAAGPQSWVLKATPRGEEHGVGAEARLLSLVGNETAIPVPGVVGVVDEHRTLPAPFFVMEAAEGEQVPARDLGELPDPAVERTARETGQYLAALHDLDCPEGYGRVTARTARSLTGERPTVDPGQLAVTTLQGGSADGSATWPTVARAWTDSALERHASTRFGDLTPALGQVLLEQLEALAAPFEPVLGRIDHGPHNLLLDADTGAITGMIDWGFTLSVPAAYDLACVEANLTLSPWAVHPNTPDRRQSVRAALRDGYRERGSVSVLEQVQRNGEAYELLALVRATTHLDGVTATAMPDATPDQVEAAAEAYRELLADRVE